jgi:hypothetical protein
MQILNPVTEEVYRFLHLWGRREAESILFFRKRHRRVTKKLSQLPIVLFSYHPCLWLRRLYLGFQVRGTKKQLQLHRQRFVRFVKALLSLRRGNYAPAVEMLDALLDKIPLTTPELSTIFDDIAGSWPNPVFDEVCRLRRQLAQLQEEQKQ